MNRGRRAHRAGRAGGRNFVSRGPSQRSAPHYVVRNSAAGALSGNPSLTLDHPHESNSETIRVGNISPNVGNSRDVQNVCESELPPKLSVLPVIGPGYHNNFPASSNHSVLGTGTIQMLQSCDEKEETCEEGELYQILGPSEQTGGKVEHENTSLQNKGSFDICEERSRNVVRLKSPLLVKNRAMRNEKNRHMQGENIKVIRPGMVLLKGYLPSIDQVKLTKLCRNLGLGPGGFYQPGYRDGASLHLKMMCLGRHWDPETSKYCDRRPIDDAKPPAIPDEFLKLVKKAVQESHDYLDSHCKGKHARNVIPPVSPDICIINFYTKTGRLGLHQDKDESQESLHNRLPVVSFSIGDTAEFLYGDHRDIDKADKVQLESGDVLIFGGESRHIFHGVSSIIPDTAPKDLLEETNLKPGRLNLTFREY